MIHAWLRHWPAGLSQLFTLAGRRACIETVAAGAEVNWLLLTFEDSDCVADEDLIVSHTKSTSDAALVPIRFLTGHICATRRGPLPVYL